MKSTTLRFNYVRKLERNRMKLQNTAIPFEAYNIPVAFTDRGRDLASTADDRVLTLYSLDRAYVGRRADVLMNDPLFTADYETYNVEVVKRLSGKSQVLTGFDISHYDTWGFAVGDLAGHRHRHERVRRAAGSEPTHVQQPAGLLALAVQVPRQLRAAVGHLVVSVDPADEGRAIRTHVEHNRADAGDGQPDGRTNRHVLL